MLRKWKDIPGGMKCPEVKEYYDILAGRRFSLFLKRCFDIAFSVALLAVLAIPMSVIAVMIKLDSKGPVFYRQERITAYGRRFMIHKFRTMVCDADKKGASVTVKNDERITRVGRWLRGLRLDELPQLLDVLAGDMSFVGTRPELPKYVRRYTKEMRATLLLPAGITSEASIRYKDEADLLDGALDVDKFYTEEILPEKMKYNLESIKRFSLRREFKTMLDTVIEVGR
jgi:lipopolysaccharide/colanic/teichoic acid biosynthesis glycosyltransferase